MAAMADTKGVVLGGIDVEARIFEKPRQNAPSTAPPRVRESLTRRITWTLVGVALMAVAGMRLMQMYTHLASSGQHRLRSSLCQQADPLSPPPNEALDASLKELNSASGKLRSAKLLSNAVQIDTSSYDDTGSVTGPDADSRWDAFPPFAKFLRDSFPTVYDKAAVEIVHEHALLYTFNGSHLSRKPIVLMAHQDVVPVEPATTSDWTYPPFSGAIEEGSVWGRGSCDCKSQLMAILTALEALLKAGFEPERTIVLSFGFDEETTGFNGAGALAKRLLERYGEGGIEMVLDEGGEVKTQGGRPWASIDVYVSSSIRSA